MYMPLHYHDLGAGLGDWRSTYQCHSLTLAPTSSFLASDPFGTSKRSAGFPLKPIGTHEGFEKAEASGPVEEYSSRVRREGPRMRVPAGRGMHG